MNWETVIGLEIHAQLATRSKIFSGAATAYGAAPNTQACLVDLGYPGRAAGAERGGRAPRRPVRAGDRRARSRGAPSSPARITSIPTCRRATRSASTSCRSCRAARSASLLEDGAQKTIRLTRAHLEEDAGKSLHESFHGLSGIDLNRAGTPLLEIVSEPDMRSAKEAVAYMKKIHQLVRYLGICDGNMQEGSFRCDANVSVRPAGTDKLGTRTETKNLNSFRFLERAIQFEIRRQIEVLEDGGRIVQETRLYDPDKDETRSMRSKEEANDYRYFPDPDLLPLAISEAFVEEVRASLPELPDAKNARFIAQYALKAADAELLTESQSVADRFEQIARKSGQPQLAATWIITEEFGRVNKEGISFDDIPMSAETSAELLSFIADSTISGKSPRNCRTSCGRRRGVHP